HSTGFSSLSEAAFSRDQYQTQPNRKRDFPESHRHEDSAEESIQPWGRNPILHPVLGIARRLLFTYFSEQPSNRISRNISVIDVEDLPLRFRENFLQALTRIATEMVQRNIPITPQRHTGGNGHQSDPIGV